MGGAAWPNPHSLFHQTPELPSNLRTVVADPLSNAEMDAIAKIDRNCRFIKGHVFLWKDGQTWEALWDMNGEITPA